MDLAKTLSVLNAMVADEVLSSYAIAGAVAALRFIEPSVTFDVDVMVRFETTTTSGLVTLSPIVADLATRGYVEWREEGIMIEGWPVQFLPVSDALDRDALETAESVDLTMADGSIVTARFVDAEHLMAIAIKVGRPKDMARIAQFMAADAIDFGRLEGILSRHGLLERWHMLQTRIGLNLEP